ncbi:MAG: fasciclin domain-containing protein, partial [Gramella sp.]|nr:fasciclin domain-containing protein [Christiangramia sp.]
MNFILKNVKLSVLALIICFGFTACDEEDDFQFEDDVVVTPDPTDDVVEANTIVDFAEANGFSSLVAAVEAAGLTATLDGDTEYTVFAPSDEAFAAFLTANGFASLDEVPTDLLELILLNHVQPGSIRSTDLTTGYIESLAEAGPDSDNPENVSLFINTDGGVTING